MRSDEVHLLTPVAGPGWVSDSAPTTPVCNRPGDSRGHQSAISATGTPNAVLSIQVGTQIAECS